MSAIESTPNGCRIQIHAAPRASKTRIVGLHDGRVKIQIAAPPVDGAANIELIKFLAAALNLPKSDLTLVTGDSGKRKVVDVRGLGADAVAKQLNLEQ